MTYKINESLNKRALTRMRIEIAQEKDSMENHSTLKTEQDLNDNGVLKVQISLLGVTAS